MEINSKDDLIGIITELQGTIATLQETVDKLAPVAEEEPAAEEMTEGVSEEVSDAELDDIDKLLQED